MDETQTPPPHPPPLSLHSRDKRNFFSWVRGFHSPTWCSWCRLNLWNKRWSQIQNWSCFWSKYKTWVDSRTKVCLHCSENKRPILASFITDWWKRFWIFNTTLFSSATRNINTRPMPPRGGGYSIKFYTGRFRPEVKTLTLKYTNFYQNGTPFIPLEQNCTPFLYLKDKPKQ